MLCSATFGGAAREPRRGAGAPQAVYIGNFEVDGSGNESKEAVGSGTVVAHSGLGWVLLTKSQLSPLFSHKVSRLLSDGKRWRTRATPGVVWNDLGYIVVSSPVSEPATRDVMESRQTRSRLIMGEEACSKGTCVNIHPDIHHHAAFPVEPRTNRVRTK